MDLQCRSGEHVEVQVAGGRWGEREILKRASCGNPLAQGANKAWRLFSIEDIEYDEEEECWRCQWCEGTSPALVSIRFELLSFFCLPQQGVPPHLADAPLPRKAVSCLQAKENIACLLLFSFQGSAAQGGKGGA